MGNTVGSPGSRFTGDMDRCLHVRGRASLGFLCPKPSCTTVLGIPMTTLTL